MSHKLTVFCLIAGFCSLITAAGSTQTELSDDEILAVIDDPDALLNLLQTTPDEAPAASISDVSSLLFTSSVRAGFGHSDNFLKKREMLVPGDYLQLEFDAYASWKLAGIKMTAMAFAEATVYDVEIEPSEETMVYLRYEAIRNRDNFDFGLNTSILHGAFIYDASLTDVSVPTGTEVRQFMPRLETFADWYASGRDKIRLAFSLERAEFNIENLDYWEPSIGLELDHLWSRGLTSGSGIFLSRKRYDDRPPRTAGGIILQGDKELEVSQLMLEQKLSWRPDFLKWLQVRYTMGVAWEDENAGQYEAMRQAWVQARLIMTNSWGRIEMSGKWGEYRYDERQVSFYDPTLSLRTHRSLAIEYSRPLPWDLEVTARIRWDSLRSRTIEDSYTERRSELLLQWSY